jgi:hypothetical protein
MGQWDGYWNWYEDQPGGEKKKEKEKEKKH